MVSSDFADLTEVLVAETVAPLLRSPTADPARIQLVAGGLVSGLSRVWVMKPGFVPDFVGLAIPP